MQDFNLKSYDLHRDHYQNNYNKEQLESWKNKNTIDYWRHERMYSNINSLIKNYPDSSWLTIGDGRYGTDANYLITEGIKNVLATDISETYLEVALRERFITNYRIENAEHLSFENNSFDFILCKEAYHHFPRPMLALYEMLRVAKKAVVLIEPQDSNILIPARFGFNTLIKWAKQVIKNRIKSKIGRDLYYSYGNYEEVGNYVFTISEREIEKVALGLNYEMVCFKGLNDSYVKGVEFENADNTSTLFRKVKNEIEKSDLNTKKGLQSSGLLIAIIFKTLPTKTCILELEKNEYVNRILPKNPYIK